MSSDKSYFVQGGQAGAAIGIFVCQWAFEHLLKPAGIGILALIGGAAQKIDWAWLEEVANFLKELPKPAQITLGVIAAMVLLPILLAVVGLALTIAFAGIGLIVGAAIVGAAVGLVLDGLNCVGCRVGAGFSQVRRRLPNPVRSHRIRVNNHSASTASATPPSIMGYQSHPPSVTTAYGGAGGTGYGRTGRGAPSNEDPGVALFTSLMDGTFKPPGRGGQQPPF